MNEYPKALYKGANDIECLKDCAIVHDPAQEAAARKDGYEMYAEIHTRGTAPAEPPQKRTYTRKAK